MLITRKRLTQLLGLLWLVDGILQLQPQMFTMNMVNGVMRPMLDGQPGAVESSLNWIVQVTTQNLTLVNLLVAIVQMLIGLSLLLGRGVKVALLASIVWAFIVWYGGEGMSMLLTGQASALTGAPGAVLLYALLALVAYPFSPTTNPDEGGILSRQQFRWAFAIFWIFMAVLQAQPYWWQDGQISQGIRAMVGQGGLNSVLVDPVLQWLSNVTNSIEIPLNIALIVVFLALGIALFFVENKHIRPVLAASIVVSLIIWYGTEAFGMIFTGMATDFNSGLLIVVMTLACWPLASARVSERRKYTSAVREAQRQSQSSAQTV
ncbi:MAG TPA: hypothetical protein VNG51_02820 [Ktedonobacteraceae bacterium]|nr:hypothetical protein [Ktedonobacteraceae bacterium]